MKLLLLLLFADYTATWITDADLDKIALRQDLDRLSLAQTRITDAGLERLAGGGLDQKAAGAGHGHLLVPRALQRVRRREQAVVRPEPAAAVRSVLDDELGPAQGARPPVRAEHIGACQW